jgi:hypothetical protein
MGHQQRTRYVGYAAAAFEKAKGNLTQASNIVKGTDLNQTDKP